MTVELLMTLIAGLGIGTVIICALVLLATESVKE